MNKCTDCGSTSVWPCRCLTGSSVSESSGETCSRAGDVHWRAQSHRFVHNPKLVESHQREGVPKWNRRSAGEKMKIKKPRLNHCCSESHSVWATVSRQTQRSTNRNVSHCCDFVSTTVSRKNQKDYSKIPHGLIMLVLPKSQRESEVSAPTSGGHALGKWIINCCLHPSILALQYMNRGTKGTNNS